MNNATILRAQERLTTLGYYQGRLDGVAGPQTIYAIKQFQSANGLARDGEIGPKTLKALFPAASATSVSGDLAVSGARQTSAAGRSAISNREGNVLTAYRDSVGILTIGVGHTTAAGAPVVTPGMVITQAESDAILSRDLAKFEVAVLSAVKVDLAQHEFDALVSLAFNIGGAAFARSTLVRKLNAGDRAAAAAAFLVWNRAGGKVLPGLTRRREAERAQFLNA